MNWAVDRLKFPRDPRTQQEVCADVDDEFAFHLEALMREEIDSGLDSTAARANALHRFGDLTRLKAECERIAMENRIMNRKIILGVLIGATVVSLLFAGFSWQLAHRRLMEARNAEQHARAAQAHLVQALTEVDPASQQQLSIREVLSDVDERIMTIDSTNPEIAARLRAVVEQARLELEQQNTPENDH